MIIGITGLNCSGKDTAAVLLEKEGFIHLSLSDLIREEARQRNIKTTRENLITLGNELRTQHGPNILAQRAVSIMNPNNNYVVTSIRNPAEVNTLQKTGNFQLIFLKTPLELRWQRAKARQRTGDGTFEQFKQHEEQEWSPTNPAHQQLKEVINMANTRISNNGTIEQLKKQIITLLEHRKF